MIIGNHNTFIGSKITSIISSSDLIYYTQFSQNHTDILVRDYSYVLKHIHQSQAP